MESAAEKQPSGGTEAPHPPLPETDSEQALYGVANIIDECRRPTGGSYRAGLCLGTFGRRVERPRHEAVTAHFPARTEPAGAIET